MRQAIQPKLPARNLAIPGATLLVVGLLGCASFPAYNPPPLVYDVPTTWAAQRQETGPIGNEGWVRSFDDPRLTQIVNEAERKNFDVALAASRLRAAWAEAGISASNLYPKINARGTASKRRTNVQTSGTGAGAAGALLAVPELSEALGLDGQQQEPELQPQRIENYQVTAELRWEIDLWGRLANLTSAELAEVQVAAADLRAARLSLAANVAKAYFNALTASAQVTVARESLTSFENTREFIASRYEVGTAEPLDLRLTRADVANARASVQESLQNEDEFTRTLQTLKASYPDGELVLVSDLPDLDTPVPAGLPAELLRRRPDILAAERQLAAAHERLFAARKDFLPDITLTGSAGSSSEEVRDLLSPETLIWNIVSELVQPIFQGGELTGRLRQAREQAIQAALNYQQTALQAFQEVEQALAAERFLREREDALATFAEESREAARLAFQQYQDGTTDILTTLESRRRALNAESGYLAVRNLRLQNRVNLYLALGGDFAGTHVPGYAAKEVVEP